LRQIHSFDLCTENTVDQPDRPAESTSGSLNAAQIGVLALLGLAAGSAYLTRHCIAAANTTIQKDLLLTEEQMGWVLGVFSGGYFIFQIPGGWLGNRFGTRRAYSAISLLWSIFTVWSSLAFSWLGLLVSRAAFGGAQAGLVPITAKVISDWFGENRRGVCSAVIAASMSIGGVVAMKLTSELMEHYDWRDIFRMYSLVGIAWAVAFYWFFRTRPQDHPWLRKSSPAEDVPTTDASFGFEDSNESDTSTPSRDTNTVAEESVDWRRLLRNRTILAINVQAMFRAAGYWLFVTWFPAFLEYRFGVTATEAGSLAAWPLAGVVVGTLIGGVCVDRLLANASNKRTSRVGVASVALFICGALSLASAWSPNADQFVLLMSLGAVFSGAANPAAWAATMDVAGKNTAVVMGMMNMAGTIGGFAMPVLLGYMIGDIKESGGDWNNVVYLVAAIYLAAAISWLFVDPDDTPERAA
jgi:MFS family permease